MTESLPALMERAGNRLLGARNSAELLEAKALAEAALHYAKVTKAANETHGDCLRIITRAEMRMANEIDRGQANGEVRDAGQPSIARPSGNSLSDLGVSSQRVSEWRDVRDAGTQVVENAISRALSEGRAPTKSEILNAAKEIKAERAVEKKDARAEKEAALAHATIAASERLGHKVYGVIYADPCWRFEPYSRDTGMDRSADNHYPTMPTDQIAAINVPAADDCVLFLWATAPMLPDALRVMEAWGFTYKTNLVWAKDRIGTGYWARSKHELLLIGTKGSIPAPSPGDQPPSVIEARVTEHSAKPNHFAEIIEEMFPNLPALEMFAREPRLGWDVWGNEVEEPVE